MNIENIESFQLLSPLPMDVEVLIYRYLHEMKMIEVLRSLRHDLSQSKLILDYFQRKSFYPYLIRHKLFKSKFFTKMSAFYFKNKVYKYVHYKLMLKCFPSIITRIKNQHIMFSD